MTKRNCKKVKFTILVSKTREFLKFLTEKKIIKKEIPNPKIKE